MKEKNPLETLIDKEELLRKLKVTKFQQVMLKYFHVTDCSVLNEKWESFWEFCPGCGANIDSDCRVKHLDRKKVAS